LISIFLKTPKENEEKILSISNYLQSSLQTTQNIMQMEKMV